VSSYRQVDEFLIEVIHGFKTVSSVDGGEEEFFELRPSNVCN
jgi:hypothetical protein